MYHAPRHQVFSYKRNELVEFSWPHWRNYRTLEVNNFISVYFQTQDSIGLLISMKVCIRIIHKKEDLCIYILGFSFMYCQAFIQAVLIWVFKCCKMQDGVSRYCKLWNGFMLELCSGFRAVKPLHILVCLQPEDK